MLVFVCVSVCVCVCVCQEEAEAIKPVEITVETEAEAGASGYSVTGGGQKGIFIKDVLKDSPAAKHLSLQQGTSPVGLEELITH